MLENLQPSTSLSSEEDQFYLEALAMFQKVQSFFCFLTIYDGSQISEHLLGPEQLTSVKVELSEAKTLEGKNKHSDE